MSVFLAVLHFSINTNRCEFLQERCFISGSCHCKFHSLFDIVLVNPFTFFTLRSFSLCGLVSSFLIAVIPDDVFIAGLVRPFTHYWCIVKVFMKTFTVHTNVVNQNVVVNLTTDTICLRINHCLMSRIKSLCEQLSNHICTDDVLTFFRIKFL